MYAVLTFTIQREVHWVRINPDHTIQPSMLMLVPKGRILSPHLIEEKIKVFVLFHITTTSEIPTSIPSTATSRNRNFHAFIAEKCWEQHGRRGILQSWKHLIIQTHTFIRITWCIIHIQLVSDFHGDTLSSTLLTNVPE